MRVPRISEKTRIRLVAAEVAALAGWTVWVAVSWRRRERER